MRKSYRLHGSFTASVMSALAHWSQSWGSGSPLYSCRSLIAPRKRLQRGKQHVCWHLTSVLRLYWSPEPTVVAKSQPCRLTADWHIWAQVAVAAHQGDTLKITFRVWRGIKAIINHSSRTSWSSHDTALPDSLSQFFFAHFDSQNIDMRTQMTPPKKDFILPVTAFKIKWDVTEVFCPQT